MMIQRTGGAAAHVLGGTVTLRSGGGGAAGGPVVVFSDTFTEASNVALSAHVPDIGTSWSLLWTTTSEATTGMIVNATLDAATQLASNNTGSIYTCNATYANANYDVTCVMSGHGVAAGNAIYLFLRIQDQENMYAVRLRSSASQLHKKVAGTWTALGSSFTLPAVGSVVKLEMIGSALKLYDDGVEIASATDSDITAAGKAGVGGSGGAELVASGDDSTTDNQIDNLVVTVQT